MSYYFLLIPTIFFFFLLVYYSLKYGRYLYNFNSVLLSIKINLNNYVVFTLSLTPGVKIRKCRYTVTYYISDSATLLVCCLLCRYNNITYFSE